MTEDMARSRIVTDEELLAAFDVRDDPVVTVSDISGQVELEPDSVRHRLRNLEEQGVVKSKKVGARALVWWIKDSDHGG